MLEGLNFRLTNNGRVLILSQREIKDHVSFCGVYEFEDLICDYNTADILIPAKSYDFSNWVYTQVKRITRATSFADYIKPDPNPFILTQAYELLFVFFSSPEEIIALSSVKGWRKKCQKAVCYILEIWEKDVQGWKPYLELLKDFDQIFLGLSHGTEAVGKITGRPCTYLPPGVDTIQFSPYPFLPHRSIDVYNMGRRSFTTHRLLLELAEQQGFFYYYDTLKNFSVANSKEHRNLLANLIKRSRYFVTNAAKFDAVGQTGSQTEIGSRFFEGAAAGAVLIGFLPDSLAIDNYFNWPDAVIQTSPDGGNIRDIIFELDAQPDRLAKISRDNVVNSLRRHDWVYRWRKVLESVDLEPTQNLLDREDYLRNLAETVSELDIALLSRSMTRR